MDLEESITKQKTNLQIRSVLQKGDKSTFPNFIGEKNKNEET